jgi:hypothetical protein
VCQWPTYTYWQWDTTSLVHKNLHLSPFLPAYQPPHCLQYCSKLVPNESGWQTKKNKLIQIQIADQHRTKELSKGKKCSTSKHVEIKNRTNVLPKFLFRPGDAQRENFNGTNFDKALQNDIVGATATGWQQRRRATAYNSCQNTEHAARERLNLTRFMSGKNNISSKKPVVMTTALLYQNRLTCPRNIF